MVERSEIIVRLREIASLLELHGGNKFKARAYVRAARALEASKESLDQLVERGRLTDLPGIGVALAHQIEELFRTGRSALLDSLRSGLPSGVLELSQVAGIGLHALRVLHEELGVRNVAELRQAAEAGRLQHASGFGPKKEQRILEAIVRYESQGPTLLLADGLRLADQLQAEISALEGVISVHLGGSLRRSAELSSDVDLVVEAADPIRGARESAIPYSRYGAIRWVDSFEVALPFLSASRRSWMSLQSRVARLKSMAIRTVSISNRSGCAPRVSEAYRSYSGSTPIRHATSTTSVMPSDWHAARVFGGTKF